MPISFARAAIVLGLLALAGPIAVDMYLPVLPAMASDLDASVAATQLSLTAHFVAIAMFQSVYGPLSDMVGRRAPLIVGLFLYVLGAVGCALAPSVEVLVGMRFIQGVGACASMIIPRAVVRDLYTGVMAARLMGLIMLIFGIGPMLSPFFGTLIAEALGWRAIFLVMLLVAGAGFVLLLTAMPETNPPEKRRTSTLRSIIADYLVLARDPAFLALTFTGSFALASFFAFLAGSPFVYVEHYGLSPMTYAILFSLHAAGFYAMAQLAGRLGARFGLRQTVLGASILNFTFLSATFAYFALGGGHLAVLFAGLFCGFAFLGLVLPVSVVLALENYGPMAGTASSMIGTLQFSCGALAIAVTGLVGDGGPLTMTAVIVAAATGTLTMAILSRRDRSE